MICIENRLLFETYDGLINLINSFIYLVNLKKKKLIQL